MPSPAVGTVLYYLYIIYIYIYYYFINILINQCEKHDREVGSMDGPWSRPGILYIRTYIWYVPYGCYSGHYFDHLICQLMCLDIPFKPRMNFTLQLIAILENRLTWPGPGALLLLAPPCSSWTRVSRGTSMRSRLNPLGLNYRFVLDGNLTIARFLVSKLWLYPFAPSPII